MATAAKSQDLPPPGGYKPITYQRIPAKTYFNGWTLIGMYLGMTAGAAYIYYLTYKKNHYEEIEQRSTEFALYPMLMAERDREHLKQLRRNRCEESKLMANVEGWKLGTWYGEPVYKEANQGKIIEPSIMEYYIHSSFRDYKRRAEVTYWS